MRGGCGCGGDCGGGGCGCCGCCCGGGLGSEGVLEEDDRKYVSRYKRRLPVVVVVVAAVVSMRRRRGRHWQEAEKEGAL